MGLRSIALSLLAVLLAIPVNAAERGWFPREEGECGWVYGRYSIYNGSGVRRIWVIGTTHMLNLRDWDETAPDVLDPSVGGWRPSREVIYGEFRVCAIAAHRKGRMQPIRITDTRNLIFREPL